MYSTKQQYKFNRFNNNIPKQGIYLNYASSCTVTNNWLITIRFVLTSRFLFWFWHRACIMLNVLKKQFGLFTISWLYSVYVPLKKIMGYLARKYSTKLFLYAYFSFKQSVIYDIKSYVFFYSTFNENFILILHFKRKYFVFKYIKELSFLTTSLLVETLTIS